MKKKAIKEKMLI